MSFADLTVVPAESPLERRIAALEAMQVERIKATAEYKIQLDLSVERRQREIDNLKSQLPATCDATTVAGPVRLVAVG